MLQFGDERQARARSPVVVEGPPCAVGDGALDHGPNGGDADAGRDEQVVLGGGHGKCVAGSTDSEGVSWNETVYLGGGRAAGDPADTDAISIASCRPTCERVLPNRACRCGHVDVCTGQPGRHCASVAATQ